jgi:hypothetical protein
VELAGAMPPVVLNLRLDARPSSSAVRLKLEDDPKEFDVFLKLLFDSVCEFYNYCVVK